MLAALLALGLGAVAPAQADPGLSVAVPESPDVRPDGFAITPRQARARAEAQNEVVEARREHPSLRAKVIVPKYFGDERYEVVYLDGRDVVVDVHLHGVSGRVVELWTGPQADTLLARGYEPSVARSLNAWYVWLPLALLFVAPFVDPRRPRRLLHLDLAVLLLFGASQYFFNRGEIHVSVPIATLLLVYLLIRLLLAGFRPRPPSGHLVPLLPLWALAVGLVLLVGFRVTLNAVDSHVIDVATRAFSAPTASSTARTSTSAEAISTTPTGRSRTSPTRRSRRSSRPTDRAATATPREPPPSPSTCS